MGVMVGVSETTYQLRTDNVKICVLAALIIKCKEGGSKKGAYEIWANHLRGVSEGLDACFLSLIS